MTGTAPAASTGGTAARSRCLVTSKRASAPPCLDSVTNRSRASKRVASTPRSRKANAVTSLEIRSPQASKASSSADCSRPRESIWSSNSAASSNTARTQAISPALSASETTARAVASVASRRSARIARPRSKSEAAASASWSVVAPMAETTTTGSRWRARSTIAQTRSIAAAVASDVPPNFMTSMDASLVPPESSAARGESKRWPDAAYSPLCSRSVPSRR